MPKVDWIGQLVYVSLITTIKISVLSMYLRIFPTRFVRWGAGILGTIAILWFINILIIVIFHCSPVAMAWDYLITTGHCIDIERFFLGNSIPNILTDLAILCLPMYEVHHLRMNRGKKICLLFVFLLGGLVVAVSIYRLKALIDLVHKGLSSDYTSKYGHCVSCLEYQVFNRGFQLGLTTPTFGQFSRLLWA